MKNLYLSLEKEVGNSIRDCELYSAYQENPSINMFNSNTKCRSQAAGGSKDKLNQQQQQSKKNHDCENKDCKE